MDRKKKRRESKHIKEGWDRVRYHSGIDGLERWWLTTFPAVQMGKKLWEILNLNSIYILPSNRICLNMLVVLGGLLWFLAGISWNQRLLSLWSPWMDLAWHQTYLRIYQDETLTQRYCPDETVNLDSHGPQIVLLKSQPTQSYTPTRPSPSHWTELYVSSYNSGLEPGNFDCHTHIFLICKAET